MLCSIAYFGQVCRASCLLAAQAATCCGQDKILVSKGKFANLSYVSTPEAPEGADSLEIHDPTLLCNALDPEIQVLTHIRGRVLTRKATLAPKIGVLTHILAS